MLSPPLSIDLSRFKPEPKPKPKQKKSGASLLCPFQTFQNPNVMAKEACPSTSTREQKDERTKILLVMSRAEPSQMIYPNLRDT